MKERITYNDLLELCSRGTEERNITASEYENIKNYINLLIQDEIILDSNKVLDFSKSFICVEFSEAYAVIYHYNP